MYQALLFGGPDAVFQLIHRQLRSQGAARGVLDLSAEECKRCSASQRALVVAGVQRLESAAITSGLIALRSTVVHGPVFPTALCDLIVAYASTTWQDICQTIRVAELADLLAGYI